MERLDYSLRKAELDLCFLCKYKVNNVVPKFLNFRMANNHLKYSSTYEQCQSNILREENRQKKSTVQNLQKEFSSLKAPLQNELILIEFAHVSTLFFGINYKILKSKSLVQWEIFYKLVHKNKTENDLEKVIFNFSKY